MILIDAHVHIHDCFDLKKFFDSAYANFKSAAQKIGHKEDDFTGVLLLAETYKDNWFQRLGGYADGKDLPKGRSMGNWLFSRTNENISLLAESANSKKLILIAGRQIITEEGLEVIACATIENFEDGIPIENLINEIIKIDALPIIPWGVGKWLGTRGEIIKHNIAHHNSHHTIYMGDNGNRPKFWPQPKLLVQARQKCISVLPGSDPLPFVSESGRAGSFGFLMQDQIDPQKPA